MLVCLCISFIFSPIGAIGEETCMHAACKQRGSLTAGEVQSILDVVTCVRRKCNGHGLFRFIHNKDSP